MADVQIKGLKELNDKLNKLKNIKHVEALLAGAIKLQELSQRQPEDVLPVDTGFMKNAHSTRINGDSAELINSAEYAVYQHEGTRYMEGRAWITKTIDESSSEIVEAISKVEKKLIESEVK